MQAVILVGGLGTRLRPLTYNTPKAMMPVLDRPFLEYVIRRLAGHGVDDIVLAISHLAPPIESYFGDGARLGVKLSYTSEEMALGTAGGVKNAEGFIHDAFFALNGDIFTDLDLTAMLDFHRKHKALVTIALTPVDDPTSYGLVETDGDGRITRFLEKPGKDEVTTNMINAGTYILEKEVLDAIPPQTNFSFEHDVFPRLLDQGKPVYAFPYHGYWMDIGTPQKYRQLNLDLLDGKSNQYRPDGASGIAIGKGSRLDPTAELTPPLVIGQNCTVDKDARLVGPLVVGSASYIGEGALVEDAIIWQRVTIEDVATVKQSIIADDCRLGTGSNVVNAVLADNVSLAPGYKLSQDSKIMPDTSLG